MGEAEAYAVYDIFINHRGPDTKKNVANLVYRRLIMYGLRVFLDKDEFQPGDPLYDKIKSAIRSSSIHVAILSVTYAQSPCCLNELWDMLDMLESGCKVKIIPIFYDVKPAHLSHIDEKLRSIEGKLAVGTENPKFEPYVEAFRNHQQTRRHDAELDRWMDALNKVSKISGIEFNKEKE
uniref:ADP-ribosyl cyclase/cyclic ADP-ribose hydrolase n=1 Tax=Araucaria cunninghamii TaxID=56994 RepID=A0A0D6QSI2_ARACU